MQRLVLTALLALTAATSGCKGKVCLCNITSDPGVPVEVTIEKVLTEIVLVEKKEVYTVLVPVQVEEQYTVTVWKTQYQVIRVLGVPVTVLKLVPVEEVRTRTKTVYVPEQRIRTVTEEVPVQVVVTETVFLPANTVKMTLTLDGTTIFDGYVIPGEPCVELDVDLGRRTSADAALTISSLDGTPLVSQTVSIVHDEKTHIVWDGSSLSVQTFAPCEMAPVQILP